MIPWYKCGKIRLLYSVRRTLEGIYCFNLLIAPITFEILFETWFTCSSYFRLSCKTMLEKLKEVICSICMLLMFNVGGWAWYCAMWNIMNLDFAISRDNLLSCSNFIILSNSNLIFSVSSPTFFNSSTTMGLILNLGVQRLKSFVKLILYGLVVQIVLYFVGNFKFNSVLSIP